jgi:hypothetical protein
MNTIHNYKYKLIKNFFSKDELSLLKIHCKKMILKPWRNDSARATNNITPFWNNFSDPLSDVLLELKLKKMEKITGLKLFKTYAYWRYYHFGSFLKFHKDREACEISVTACMHKTDNWPIVINGKEIEMEEGDGVVYLGCELEHGRKNEFTGDGMAQIFMHYVDQKGPYANHKDDKIDLIKKNGELKVEMLLDS